MYFYFVKFYWKVSDAKVVNFMSLHFAISKLRFTNKINTYPSLFTSVSLVFSYSKFHSNTVFNLYLYDENDDKIGYFNQYSWLF